MKKFLMLLIVCVCLVFSGCSSGTIQLVQNADGSISEYYSFPFPEQEFINAGVTIGELNNAYSTITATLNGKFNQLLTAYQANVTNSATLTNEQKQQYLSAVDIKVNNPLTRITEITYVITYKNTDCYYLFKNVNQEEITNRNVETIVEKNLFTITTKTIKDSLFDKIVSESITVGQTMCNQAEIIMKDTLGETKWNSVKNAVHYDEYADKFEYIYVVPTSRLHTNAKSTYAKNGYYYNTWEIDLNNYNEDGETIVKIETWTTKANKPVWYATSLLISGVIITTIYIVGKHKERKLLQETKKEVLD